MTRALSPALAKRGLTVHPGVPSFVVEMNADMLIDASNGAKLAAADRRITTEVLDVYEDMSSARVFTAQFNDYLHLVKSGGRWQILNVLWHAPPASPATADTAAIETVVRGYAAALVTADAPALIGVLHPLARVRALALPPQNRPRIVRDQNPETIAAGLAAGQIRSSGTVADAQIAVLGVDDDIAAAKLTLGRSTTYAHLALQGGRWRIVNTLAYTAPAPATTAGR